jgi:O-acetyl-ADP-ribose deacetylase (regulator of RNase III)
MQITIHKTALSLSIGDITAQHTDAIVNAANSALAEGSGVDGAIHKAGGPKIMEECSWIQGGCPTGTAVITSGGNLKAKFVIHTVGPVYNDGKHGEPALLASAYSSSLELAVKHGIKTIAFPSLSTGAYGYPFPDAAGIALNSVKAFLLSNSGLSEVRFVLYNQTAFDAYKEALNAIK